MSKLLVIQQIDREGPGFFKTVAESKGLKTTIFRPYLGERLPTPEPDDLLLIMGGPMGVSDLKNPHYSWLLKEINLIKYAIKHKIALIGVCLGAQLLAYSMGGSIEPLRHGKPPQKRAEIGWGTIKFNTSGYTRSIRGNCATYLNVLHWHGDRILLPKDSELIASSEACKEQIFAIGDKAFGLQCHLEVTQDMIYKWIREDKEFITREIGRNAGDLIFKQQITFGENSTSSRLKEIKNLFDYLLR